MFIWEENENTKQKRKYWKTEGNVRLTIIIKIKKSVKRKEWIDIMMKLTTDKFIIKSNLIHDNKYDYSNSEYKTIKSKIKILCPIHGEFEQVAEKHLLGRGCIECGKNKFKQTCFEKYGVYNVFSTNWCKEKIKNTLIEKYGVDSPIKNLDISNKIKQTNLIRYGVENPFQSDVIIKNKIIPNKDYVSILKKSKQTCLKKYGVDNYFKTLLSKTMLRGFRRENIIQDIFRGDRLKNKVLPLFDEKDYIDITTNYNWKCCVCDSEFTDNLDDGKIPRCNVCFPYIIDSKAEYDLINYIKSINNKLEVIHGDRKLLSGLELDIYIPSLKLAIEFDGLYYHSEISGGKNKTYHLNKTNLCNTLGIRLIHIFEDEWVNKNDIVKSRLNSLLNYTDRIYARKCEIRMLNFKTSNVFLEKNHLQSIDTSNIQLGLFFNNELVSVMTFGPLRKCLGNKNKTGCFEMYRFCNNLNTTVVGSAGKLLSYFIKTYNPTEIISYADRRWSVGNLYEKLNFICDSVTPVNYFYTKDHFKKYHRFSFRKDQLHKKLERFNPTLSEWENMKNNGWDRIWDCGCLKYKWLSNIN